MNKMIRVIVVLVVIIAASFIFVFHKNNSKQPIYEEVVVHRDEIVLSFRVNGSVEPRNRVVIKPQVSGRIEDVLVKEGQKVKKGDILAWISSTERATLLDIAKAKSEQEYEKWKEIYKPTPVISPLDGFVISRDKEPGQNVLTSDSILVLADELIVKVYVDETDLRYIKIGQKVKISLDAYPDIKFTGLVEEVAYESTLINNVTVYEVKIKPLIDKTEIEKREIAFPNKKEWLAKKSSIEKNFVSRHNTFYNLPDIKSILRSGMSATVDVIMQQKRNILVVPIEAVHKERDSNFVLLKTPNGAVKQNIELGISDGKKVEIISGLNEGDVVLIESPTKNVKKSLSKSTTRMLNPMSAFRRE